MLIRYENLIDCVLNLCRVHVTKWSNQDVIMPLQSPVTLECVIVIYCLAVEVCSSIHYLLFIYLIVQVLMYLLGAGA